MSAPTNIFEMLTRDEARRPMIYDDSDGGPVILATRGNVTGGVGRNMSAVPFSDDEIDLMLRNDVARAQKSLSVFAWYNALDEVRQAGVVNMVFNLGSHELLLHWPHLLSALASGDWQRAHDEALDPHWISQVHARGERVADMFLTGEWQ